MTLREIEASLKTLTAAEKARLVQLLVPDITHAWPGIDKSPGVCGGAARLTRTRIAVWSLEEMRRQGWTEADILRHYPQLAAADLANAWSYVSSHTDEIDWLIRQNLHAMNEAA